MTLLKKKNTWPFPPPELWQINVLNDLTEEKFKAK